VVQAEPGDLLTVPEVAARLRVSRVTVYRLVRADALEVIRISNSIRVQADVLARLLSRGQRSFPAGPALTGPAS
jgi:excisionase family DNA binding protein